MTPIFRHLISRSLTFVFLGSHLIGSSANLFRNAHHPRPWPYAACGGLGPDPATRPRGTYPHLSCSTTLRSLYIKSPFPSFVTHSGLVFQHPESHGFGTMLKYKT